MIQVVEFFSVLFTRSNNRSLFFRNWLRNRLAGYLVYRAKSRGTSFKAGSAFYAFVLVNDMDLVLAACNRLYGTFPEANHTGLAFIRINIVGGDFTK